MNSPISWVVVLFLAVKNTLTATTVENEITDRPSTSHTFLTIDKFFITFINLSLEQLKGAREQMRHMLTAARKGGGRRFRFSGIPINRRTQPRL